jgi:hypothetical protein
MEGGEAATKGGAAEMEGGAAAETEGGVAAAEMERERAGGWEKRIEGREERACARRVTLEARRHGLGRHTYQASLRCHVEKYHGAGGRGRGRRHAIEPLSRRRAKGSNREIF